MTDNDRPQDVGRRHRRAGEISPETDALLDRYRAAMRAELAGLLDELAPAELVQTSLDGTADRVVGLKLDARRERWDLAIRLARELANGSDAAPAGTGRADSSPAPARARSAPRLSARERKAIGG